MSVRIIPRLDIKGPNVVKGIHLEGLRVLGTPERFAFVYAENGADELLYMDVVASLYGRNSILEIVRRTSKEIFIPLTVGGGIRTLDDIREVLRSGADKVSLNTAAIHRPELVHEASRRFGSSTILVSVEAVRQPSGKYEAFTDNGRERTGLDAVEWAVRAAELGAGELLVTSVDREGTGKGYDVELTRQIADQVSIPVIACGGAGTMSHVREVITEGHADAVSLASLLHYSVVERGEAGPRREDEGNLEFLKSGRTFSNLRGATLPELKEDLRADSIPVRVHRGEIRDVFTGGRRVPRRSDSVAIIDYGMGNLFSVKSACENVGIKAFITSSPAECKEADGIILPGVGAFADAMKTLRDLGMVQALRWWAKGGRPLIGICLGMQLLMAESEEFGAHEGLGLIDGVVRRLPSGMRGWNGRTVKIPEVCWNEIHEPRPGAWMGTPLEGIPDGESVFFVHSFVAHPSKPANLLAVTTCGTTSFCSALRDENILAFQFHPERSGAAGIDIYRRIRSFVARFSRGGALAAGAKDEEAIGRADGSMTEEA